MKIVLAGYWVMRWECEYKHSCNYVNWLWIDVSFVKIELCMRKYVLLIPDGHFTVYKYMFLDSCCIYNIEFWVNMRCEWNG